MLMTPVMTLSQVVVDGRFRVHSLTTSVYEVAIDIKTNNASSRLGTSTLQFTFDNTDLSYPASPASGTDYTIPLTNLTYFNSDVTRPLANRVSINIDYSGPSTYGDLIGSSWTEIARVKFSVLDASGSSNLVWVLKEVFADNNTTQWTNGTFANLNTSPLPVELISFSGYDRGDRVHLHWETATEFENYGFEIQRQEGEGEWTPIGFVPGKGTVNYPVVYDWDDMLKGVRTPRAFLDKLRYRLRQIDRDGTDELSPIVEVAMGETPSTPQLTAYPNPARGQTAAACVLQEQRNVTLTLHDAAGREVLRLLDAQDVPAGSHVYDLSTDRLPAGMYMLRMIAGRHVSVQNITVLK